MLKRLLYLVLLFNSLTSFGVDAKTKEDHSLLLEQLNSVEQLIQQGFEGLPKAQKKAFRQAENFLNLDDWDVADAYLRSLYLLQNRILRALRKSNAEQLARNAGREDSRSKTVIQSFLALPTTQNSRVDSLNSAEVDFLVEIANIEALRAQVKEQAQVFQKLQNTIIPTLPTPLEIWTKLGAGPTPQGMATDIFTAIKSQDPKLLRTHLSEEQISSINEIARLQEEQAKLLDQMESLAKKQDSILSQLPPRFSVQDARAFSAGLHRTDKEAKCCGRIFAAPCKLCPINLPSRRINQANGKQFSICSKILAWLGYQPERFVKPSVNLNLPHHRIIQTLNQNIPGWAPK